MLDSEQVVNFCAKHHISFNQFMLCWLTHNKQYEELYKYTQECTHFTAEERNDLEERGFLINLNKGTDTFADGYVITDKFLKDLMLDSGEFTEELWENYPQFVVNGDTKFPARTIGPEDLDPIYSKAIKGSVKKHKEILEELIKQKNSGTIYCGIEKWVKGRMWINQEPKKGAHVDDI